MAKASDILIAFDDGHGIGTAGKRTPDGYRENYFNSKMIDFAVAAAKRCGFKTMLTAPGDADASLKSRTDKANKAGADAFVSGHYNAIDDKWRDGEGGIETFHYPGSSSGKKLAQCIHKYLIKGTKLRDRGVKAGNYHVLRESNMPAALPECGFMDIKKEAELMKSSAYQKECGEEIVQGLCEFFDVKFVAEKKETTAKDSGKAEAKAETYSVVKNISGYKTADDAKNKKKQASTVTKGSYFIYKKSGSMINVTKKKGSPGSWINPADNKADTTKYHVVQKDESVWELAQKYKTTVDKIATLNKLKDPGKIYPGQKLRVK